MKNLFANTVLIVLLSFIANQAISADYPITSYLGSEQGLSNNSVRCIYQDHRGYIWFGTYDGLNRYDGYSIRVFRNNFNNQRSLVNNWINAIDEDDHGNLWVGTRQGVCVFKSLSNSFSPVYCKSPQNKVRKITSIIRDIERDEDGNMFIGTADAGLIFVPRGDSIGIQVPLENEWIPNILKDVAAIKKGAGKKIWVFTRGKGLCLYDYKSQKLKLVNSFLKSVNCLETKGDLLWVGTNNGVYQYNFASNSYGSVYNGSNGLSQKDVVSLLFDRNNNLWCGTNGGGVTLLDVSSGQLSNLTAGKELHSLTGNSVHAIREDREGRVWIGVLRGGINVIDPHKRLFQTVVSDPATANTLVSNYILSSYEEPNGLIWIGTDGGGISVWNRTTNNFTNYKHNPVDPGSLSNDFVTDIKGDYLNKIWVATYRGGINCFDNASHRFERYPYTDASSKKVSITPLSATMLEDEQRQLWAGTLQGGLFRLNRQAKSFECFDETLKDLFVLFRDRANVVWSGNLSQLIQIDRIGKMHRFFTIGTPVRSIHEDRRGNFWVGTEGGGLLLFDRKSGKIVTRYTTDEGLCNNAVLNILEDEQGNLWMSTFNGISKFNTEHKTFTNFYQSDGLKSNQFSYVAAAKLHTGELLFGGIKGLTIFNPAHIVPANDIPKVLFKAINVNNTPIEQENGFIAKATENEIEALRIPFNKATLSVEYGALEYSVPEKIQYAYYLEGWDRGWNNAGNTRTAIYTRLPEGTYLLRVKCTNQDGIWSTQEQTLKIIVLPPWYRSWWAYLIYCMLVVGLIYSYLKYRSRQTRLKYEVKIAKLNAENERSEKERSQAQLALEKAELEKERAEREKVLAEREKERVVNEKEKELNEKKISFFTNISHEFRTPLTLIINPVKNLLKKNEDEQSKSDSGMNIVYRNAKRMLSLVDQLVLFGKAESGIDRLRPSKLNLHDLASEVYLCFTQQAKNQSITYIFDCPNKNAEIYADKEKLEIILYNLLSNALKYTPPHGTIKLSIEEHTENVVITVQDNGAGIPSEIGGKLFDKFYKPERNKTNSKAGFGIGLFLVKHFTDQHGGVVSYESEEGNGATFTIKLQRGKDHYGPEVVVSEADTSFTVLEELKEDTYMPGTIEDKEPMTEVVSEKNTILIIDDDESIRQYLIRLFRDNYLIYQAENGTAGLKAAQKYLPDLIISDIHMQGMDGIELSKAVKEDDQLSHIPVILLTGATSDELKLKGLEGGADDYIVKPFDSKLLMARVTNLLKNRNTLQKYFYNEITLNKSDIKISPEYKEFLDKCISIVESHLNDKNFSVKTLIAEMGMSHSTIFRKVKSVSGQPVNVFIRFIRLRKAGELFINTDYSIKETSYKVGFNDVRYFREQFNKLFGMNPSDYIKKYRNIHGKQYTVNKESVNPENKDC